jgi:phosphatidylserine/phosphatidylglycerophosphate/cardiolipin synthase-like enzyme
MPDADAEDRLEELRIQNRLLLEKVADYRRQLSQNEASLVQVVLTLDDRSRFELRPGVDFDATLTATLDRMLSTGKSKLRIAIPYVTPGGYADFVSMMGQAISTPSEILLMFRYPGGDSDKALHQKIQKDYQQELAIRKIAVKYLGDEGRSGLHAKVVVRDEEEALVSSANWTGYSLSSNAEVGLLTRSRRAVRFLVRWFDFCFANGVPWRQVIEDRRSVEQV